MLAHSGKTQELMQNSFYMYNSQLVNPAVVGTNGDVRALLNHREQWTNFDGNPSSSYVSINSKLPHKLGGGLTLFQEKFGVTKYTGGQADIAYKIRLTADELMLSFGIKTRFSLLDKDFSDLRTESQGDPLKGKVFENEFRFNSGVGAFLYNENFYVGFSALSLIDYSDKEVNTGALDDTYYCVVGGYLFELNSALKFKPTVFVKSIKHVSPCVDINANFQFFDKVWVGAMYRWDNAVGVNVLCNIGKKLQVGYAYEHSVSELAQIHAGAHEIMLGYVLFKGNSHKHNPIYF